MSNEEKVIVLSPRYGAIPFREHLDRERQRQAEDRRRYLSRKTEIKVVPAAPEESFQAMTPPVSEDEQKASRMRKAAYLGGLRRHHLSPMMISSFHEQCED